MASTRARGLEIAVAAVLVGGAAVTSAVTLSRPYRQAPTAPLEIASDWEHFVATGHRIGAPEPVVTVVVFSDYQCPTCRKWTSRMRKLLAKYPDRLGIVFRHYPLSIRPGSIEAAVAAECAGQQGKFLEMHVELLRNAESLGDHSWTDYARRAGIEDLVGFDTCLGADSVRSSVDRDREAARDGYVTAAPTFFVGEEMYAGVPWDLESIITRRLEAQ